MKEDAVRSMFDVLANVRQSSSKFSHRVVSDYSYLWCAATALRQERCTSPACWWKSWVECVWSVDVRLMVVRLV